MGTVTRRPASMVEPTSVDRKNVAMLPVQMLARKDIRMS